MFTEVQHNKIELLKLNILQDIITAMFADLSARCPHKLKTAPNIGKCNHAEGHLTTSGFCTISNCPKVRTASP